MQKREPCQGQVTMPSSTVPSSRGPARCVQVARCREGNSRTTRAREAQHERGEIHERDAAIEQSMHQANAAISPIQIAPISEASDCRARGSSQSQQQSEIGSASNTFVLISEPDEVKQCRTAPSAEGDISEDGMQRMAEPCPIENVFEFTAGLPWLAEEG